MTSFLDGSPRPGDARSRAGSTVPSPSWFSGDVLLDYISSGDQVPSIVSVRVTISVVGSDPIESVRIELSNESDLFFLFEATYDSESYNDLRGAQDLTVDFADFPPALTDIFTAAAVRDGEFKLQFTDDGEPMLTVQQGLKFKTVNVFSLHFNRPSDETVKNRIQMRYHEVRAQLAGVRENLNNVYAMLKIKNPSVLKQVTTPRK
jgi:hypothetical protein